MKRLSILGAAAALLLFAGVASATSSKPYTIVAWDMPAPYVQAHTPIWPQTLAFYTGSDTIDLNALNGDLLCGHQYQIDAYNTSETTASLIAGGYLNGPSNPKEDLVPGGWGVAYRLVNEPACEQPSPMPSPSPSPSPTPSASPSPSPVVTPVPSAPVPSAPVPTPPATSTEVSTPAGNVDSLLLFAGMLVIGFVAFAVVMLRPRSR